MSSSAARPRTIVPLEPHELLVETAWGGWVVVPTYNIDVTIGPVRDGVIEPWTTRLVQEVLRRGDGYFNAGANYGYYAALGASIVGSTGRMIAVEPNPHILPYLLKTTYWCGIVGHTDVYNCALWHEAGQEVEFHFDPQYLGGGSTRSLWGVSFETARKAASLEQAIWNHENVAGMFNDKGKWLTGLGSFVSFKARTQTIDALTAGLKMDLIHLDIEGAEPFALLGCKETIRANPDIKLITEWSSHTFRHGSAEIRDAFADVFAFMMDLGYRVRLLEARQADNGAIYFSSELSYEWMTQHAIHGDYFWTR